MQLKKPLTKLEAVIHFELDAIIACAGEHPFEEMEYLDLLY